MNTLDEKIKQYEIDKQNHEKPWELWQTRWRCTFRDADDGDNVWQDCKEEPLFEGGRIEYRRKTLTHNPIDGEQNARD